MAKVLILGSFSRSLLDFRGHLIRRMIDDGHQVVAVAPEISEKVEDTLHQWGATYRTVHMERVGMSPAQDLKTLWQLHQLFVDEEPDIFFGYTIKPVVYGLLAAWLADVPSRYAMITGLGSAFTQVEGAKQYLLQAVASMLYAVSLRTSQRVIFQDADDAYLFCARRLVGGPEQVALVNGSGIDLTVYHPAPFPEELSFLLIGRLTRGKGIAEYVAAARRIREHHPQVKFRLVGWPDDGPSAVDPAELQDWVCNNAVDYLGYLDDVRPAIADSSVYVLPSYREGTPRSVLEAMAMGRPVITTNVAGCRQTVEPGENGFLVPPRDVQALTRAMTHFIGEPDLVRAMGVQSRKLATSRFDVEQVTDAILAALELGSRRMPPPLPIGISRDMTSGG